MDLILEKRNDLKENYMHVFFFLRDFSVAKNYSSGTQHIFIDIELKEKNFIQIKKKSYF
jgi:hypothetical protein